MRHIQRFSNLLVGDLDKPVGIGIVIPHIPEQLPGSLPDSIGHAIIRGTWVFRVVLDFIFFNEFFKGRCKVFGKKIILLHKRTGL